jgi:hypothetical protein
MSELITIPRLGPHERGERYEARLQYILMGPNRSLDHLAQKLTKSTRLLKRWSSEDHWVDHATTYDNEMAQSAIREAAAAYRKDLEEHRERYSKSGKALHAVAVEMLARLRANTSGIEYTQSAISQVSRALVAAADLEAHALRLGDLLPRLTDDADDETAAH